MESLLLNTALSFITKGLHIFPCEPNGKQPIGALAPQGLKSASDKEEDIQTWWSFAPNANIGLPCGSINGFFVVDVDAKSKGFESLTKLQETYNIPATYTVSTPNGGLHIYFKHVDGLKNRVGMMAGIDIRTDGGYVVACGSKLPAGNYAEHIKGDITDAPEWLIDLIKSDSKTSGLDKQLQTSTATGDKAVTEGGRNNYMTSLLGLLRAKDISEDAATACAFAENLTKLKPPLPDSELKTIIKSVYRYQVDIGRTIADEAKQAAAQEKVAAKDAEDSKTYESANDLAAQMVAYLNDADLVKGTPTGFESFDALLGGGKRLMEITGWHAHAKTGKNAVWHKLMHSWLSQGIPIAYASRELSPAREVLPNLLSIHHKENAWKLKNTEKYASTLPTWPIYFSKGYGYFPYEEIELWIVEMMEKGVKHFWFDHLHYMLMDPEDHKEASILIKKLKSLALNKNIHIDLIIQPNKLLEGQKLGLATIKGGAAIGQAIDNLIVLEREKDHTNVMKLTLDVARNRQANPGSIWLQYDKDTTDFVEVDKETLSHPTVRPQVLTQTPEQYWSTRGHRAKTEHYTDRY